MQTFSIGKQIETEIAEFRDKKVQLAATGQEGTVRYLKNEGSGYYFNQCDTIALIDFYYNSKFKTGEFDSQGKRKIFLNIGKFRTEVSAKQIDIDTKDFRFIPDDYADTYTAVFMQKDFKEWAKDTSFGELVNQCVDNFPKYGTVVLKQVGKSIEWMPLQNLINEQTAENLQEAAYVIEAHPDMRQWELEAMRNWKTEGVHLKYGETLTVYERYGYVPKSWLDSVNGKGKVKADDKDFVDAVVIAAKRKQAKPGMDGWHVFFAEQITKRPYREAHWNKQHGRWLGLGVMEDLVENQEAKNIIVNLITRSLEWSGKRLFQTADESVAAKNLVRDVEDGAILEVGQSAINEIPLQGKTNQDFTTYLAEWEKNSDQKSFTYEVATGEALPSGTPFRLGVVLSNSVNSFFQLKREKLGLFLKKAIEDFMIPQFIRDMGNEERTLGLFTGEPGFEVLKDAATKYVASEAARVAIMSGQVVDTETITSAIEPFSSVKQVFFTIPPQTYRQAKVKFGFTVTGEEIDLPAKLETLGNAYQAMLKTGDPRAERVLERIMALTGENMAQFGAPPKVAPAMPQDATGTLPTPNGQGDIPAGA